MPACLPLLPPTDDEVRTIGRLAHPRTAPARAVARARIVWRAQRGARVPRCARMLGITEASVRTRPKRFGAGGVAELGDAPRRGRPPTDTPDEGGAVIAAGPTEPADSGVPFGRWTLDRLTAYPHVAKGLPISRSRIGEILQAEGLRRRTQETRFGERVGPDFVAKRGRSLPSTRRHPRVVPWSARTKWDRRRPRTTPAPR